jgi:hypothetical protein
MKVSNALVGLAALALTPFAASAAPLTYADDMFWSGGGVVDGIVSPGVRTDLDNALGAPDGNFLSLGLGGFGVFSFGTLFQTTSNVFEVTFNCSTPGAGLCSTHKERVEVLTSMSFNGTDLTGFVSQGFVDNGDAQGGTGAVTAIVGGPFAFLALLDVSPIGGGSLDGFDVDAVGVQAVPVPAAVVLLGSAIAGLGLLGRRRKAA